MFTDLSLQDALCRAPSSQTSHYRLPLWVRQSGQLQNLLISFLQIPQSRCKVYQSLITDHSLQER